MTGDVYRLILKIRQVTITSYAITVTEVPYCPLESGRLGPTPVRWDSLLPAVFRGNDSWLGT